MKRHVLVIDQGTTSTRAMIFGPELEVIATAQSEFPQIYPQSGWVEHDPDALWNTTLSTARAALAKADLDAGAIAAIGITNQRETTLVWDRATGAPIANAIVWQDRRTAAACAALEEAGHGENGGCAHRIAARPVFLRHQDRLDPRSRARRPRPGGGR